MKMIGCDKCPKAHPLPAEHYVIMNAFTKEVVADLGDFCKTHRPGKRSRGTAEFGCKNCDKKFETEQGLNLHVTKIHKRKKTAA